MGYSPYRPTSTSPSTPAASESLTVRGLMMQHVPRLCDMHALLSVRFCTSRRVLRDTRRSSGRKVHMHVLPEPNAIER